VEDPVEYTLPGVSHTQVRKHIGLDFLPALRSVIRHDPDCVFVGEVREREVMEFIFKIAITGHLVVTSLHTMNAVASIQRLIDLTEEPFILSSGLSAIVNKRLVRKLCKECSGEEVELSDEEVNRIGLSVNSVKVAKGCTQCNHTGYRGRVAVYEFLTLDKNLKDYIRKKDIQGLQSALAEHSHKSLKCKAIEEVEAGTTTLEEVIRLFGKLESEA